MGQARLKRSQTDHYARKIAAAFAAGSVPISTPDLEFYLDHSPGEIFAALDAFVRPTTPDGNPDPLALGYLFLVQELLERLRHRMDGDYEDAMRLVGDFQRRVAELITESRINDHVLAFLAGALHQAKIPVSPELAAATENLTKQNQTSIPVDVAAAVESMLDSCDGDPFLLVDLLAEVGHVMPGEVRALLPAVLSQSQKEQAREGAVLFLLDADPIVRRGAAQALTAAARNLSPISMRRLIAMRNWRPNAERAGVDDIVRTARAGGIDCAQWEAGGVEAMLATAIDGSGAQGFTILSPAGRRKRMSSVLVKNGLGDAWSGPPESRRQIEAALAETVRFPMIPVSRAYLDRVVRHHLAIGLAQGVLPPAGLLQVAETLGGADWQPARVAWREVLAVLIADVPPAMLEPKAVSEVLRSSADWAGLGRIAESWFENDQQIARLVTARARRQAKLAEYVLQNIITRRRDKWAEHFFWTALWAREAPADPGLPWRKFAILARALIDGRDVAEISVMRDIAMRTVMALADA